MAKGQISLFIIVGIIVLLIAAFLFVALRSEPSLPVLDDMARVQRFVQNCLETTGAQGARIIAIQGGWLNVSRSSVLYEELPISYGYRNRSMILPTRAMMERELAQYVDSNLLACVDNFSAFPDLRVRFEVPKSKVAISDSTVTISSEFPVTVDSHTERMFTAEAAVPLGRLHGVAAYALSSAAGGWLDMSGLSTLATVRMIPAGSSVVFFITDDHGTVFATAQEGGSDLPPAIQAPDTLELQDELEYNITILCSDPEGGATMLEDDSPFVMTKPDGTVSIAAKIPGTYTVGFRCYDSNYNAAEKSVKVTVHDA